jgi:hypothetical protein
MKAVNAGCQPAGIVAAGRHDELVHLLRVADGELQSGDGAHRIPEHVGLLEAHRVHEGRHVVRQVGIGDGPFDVGSAAVALKFEGADPVGGGEPGDDGAHGGDVHVGTVQHDQRFAGTGHLVVHLHAVNFDAVAFGGSLCRGRGPAACKHNGCGNHG